MPERGGGPPWHGGRTVAHVNEDRGVGLVDRVPEFGVDEIRQVPCTEAEVVVIEWDADPEHVNSSRVRYEHQPQAVADQGDSHARG